MVKAQKKSALAVSVEKSRVVQEFRRSDIVCLLYALYHVMSDEQKMLVTVRWNFCIWFYYGNVLEYNTNAMIILCCRQMEQDSFVIW